MRITFLGNFEITFTSENHYLKTLLKMGHQVVPLQESKATWEEILHEAEKSDMFLWVHTHGWKTEGIEGVLERLKEKGIPTVGYHLDLWLGIEREKDLQIDPYWKIEYFFSVDKLMVDMLNKDDKLPKAYFLPAGVWEDESYIADFDPEFAHDVVFVGSSVYHKEWGYRSELIEWLKYTYGDRFVHYGRGGLGTIRERDLNKLYSSSKVVIGDTLCKGFKYPYYLSDRVFETTGRNGFIIHPYIKGIEDLYKIPTPDNKKEGVLIEQSLMGNVYTHKYFDTSEAEIITYPFGDFHYLQYLIDYYLKNDEEREVIRKRGHERTLRDHTYTSRMQFILNTIQNGDTNKSEDC